MQTCRNCKNGHFTGGQQELADKQKRKVETLNYIYCKGSGYVDIIPSDKCDKFDERPVYQTNPEERCKHCFEKGIMFCICQKCKTKDLPDENCQSCFGSGTERHCPKCGTVAKPIEEYEHQ